MAKGWRCRTNYNVNPFVGLSGHNSVSPIGLPAYLCHVEFSVVQGLWLGSFLSVGRKKKIVSDHLLFVGRMSDAGLGIPHISIPPSWMNILTSLFASSNTLFGSSQVSLACRNLIWGNQDCDIACTPFGKVPFSLNLCCFDPISLPTDVVVLWGSTYVGMTWGDIVAAMIDFAISIACDLASWGIGELASRGFRKLMRKVAAAGSDVGDSLMQRALKRVRAKAGEWAGDSASSGMKAYLEKAAKTEALANAIDLTDDELAVMVKKGIGSSYSEGFDDVVSKLGRSVREGVDEFPAESLVLRTASEEAESVLKKAEREAGAMAAATVKQMELRDALIELDKVVVARRASHNLWEAGQKAVKSSLSKVVWRSIKYGNLLGDGTSGGLLSSGGLGWTNLLKPQLAASSKEYSDWFDLDSLGQTSSDDAVKLSGAQTDGSGSSATVEESDDDYWYTTNDVGASDGDYSYESGSST